MFTTIKTQDVRMVEIVRKLIEQDGLVKNYVNGKIVDEINIELQYKQNKNKTEIVQWASNALQDGLITECVINS